VGELFERVKDYLGEGVVEAKNKRCVSVCSAGLDSTISACIMKHLGFDVTLMYFDYGHRARAAEEYYVRKITEELGVKLKVISSLYVGKLGGSPLTDSDITLPCGRESVESSKCWVPARNAVFMSYALAYCDRYKIPFITMGINRTESNYPDHTKSFIDSFNEFAKWGALNPPRLVAPCFTLIKKEEVLLMGEIDCLEILGSTWSCDIGLEDQFGRFKMCGKCGCCHSSKKAFLEAKIKDSREHASYSIENLSPYATEKKNG
jgi:7-cyano-7-deazaguanine synthase